MALRTSDKKSKRKQTNSSSVENINKQLTGSKQTGSAADLLISQNLKKNSVKLKNILQQNQHFTLRCIPYNYYWMWYIIEEKEKKKEAIVLFIEEKTFFFYSFFKKKQQQQQPMWNECDFLNVLKFEQKKQKILFPPAVCIYQSFFFLTVAWVFI